MADPIYNLPLPDQQSVALHRFELAFETPDTYDDPSSGLRAIRLDAWHFLVPDIPDDVPVPQDIDELQALYPRLTVDPAPALALLLLTRAVDLVEIDCTFKGSPADTPFPADATLILLHQLVRHLPAGTFRFLAEGAPIPPDTVRTAWQDRALAAQWPDFQTSLVAFLYMQQVLGLFAGDDDEDDDDGMTDVGDPEPAPDDYLVPAPDEYHNPFFHAQGALPPLSSI